jgi:hypothetical protein
MVLDAFYAQSYTSGGITITGILPGMNVLCFCVCVVLCFSIVVLVFTNILEFHFRGKQNSAIFMEVFCCVYSQCISQSA